MTGEPGHIIEEETQFATESDIYFEVLEEATIDTNGKAF
ncbi:hypothetical protein ACEQPO_08145 [Bacillus sp. SL00103]